MSANNNTKLNFTLTNDQKGTIYVGYDGNINGTRIIGSDPFPISVLNIPPCPMAIPATSCPVETNSGHIIYIAVIIILLVLLLIPKKKKFSRMYRSTAGIYT